MTIGLDFNLIANLNHIFLIVNRLEWDQISGGPKCICPFFSAKFSDGNCYQEYTRGPCAYGKLIIMDRDSGVGKCVCSSEQV